jgi:hypothetical protein
LISTCPSCGSVRKIPVVYGNMRDAALELFDRGLIALGSSIFVGDLETWECGDCWTRYGSRQDTENEQLYRTLIRETFDNYKTVPLESRLSAKGLWILRLITTRLFQSGITQARIELSPEGARAMVEISSEWQETTPPPPSLLGPIVWLVGNQLKTTNSDSVPFPIEFKARIDRTDKRFKLIPNRDLPFLSFSIQGDTEALQVQ